MSEMSDFKKNYFKHLEEEVTAILKENQNIVSVFSLSLNHL